MEKYDVYYDSAVDDIEYQPSNDGSWYQVRDVEPILNSLQQLKAEILPLCESGIRYSNANGLGSVKSIFERISAKLSAV